MADSKPAFKLTRLFSAIGPGLVIACVCIGPGSILTSSQVGADSGYSKAWVVVVSVVFMLVYTCLAMKLGVVTGKSACLVIREEGGAWLSILLGGSVFFIAAAYQFGNNLGVHSAINGFYPSKYWILLFNAAALLFIFGFKNLYKLLETMMAIMVAVMLLSFAINLGFAQPNLGELAMGLIPFRSGFDFELPLMGLVGTTFVMSNAFYQSYLVRFKGWTAEDMQSGFIDASVGTAIMALITLMILCTAAAVFHGLPGDHQLTSVSQVGQQLEPFFGARGRIIFSVGLFAAAFSSFVVNSMVGGFVLSDAFGWGSSPEETWPRRLTAVVLLAGMAIALAMILLDWEKPVGLIVAAQAATVLAAPLIAATLLWLTNKKSVMGKHANGPVVNTIAAIGLIVLLLISANIVMNKIVPTVSSWL